MIKKTAVALVMSLAFGNVYAACLDGKTAVTSIHSKVRGFYINDKKNGDSTSQYVILDKATCKVFGNRKTLAPTTSNAYYLEFSSEDTMLYSALLSAEARGIEVEFVVGGAAEGDPRTNNLHYIVSPSSATQQ